MRIPSAFLAAIALVVAAVGVPLAAVAVANAARPVIKPAPAGTSSPVAAIPAMPEAPGSVRPLTASFEKLPVVRDGSVVPARPFVAGYQQLSLGDLAAATALIDTAAAEIRVAPESQAAVRAFVDALIHPPADTGEQDPELDPDADPDAPVVIGTFETPTFKALAEPAMAAIKADPANATAINDLAVAIATRWIAEPSPLPTDSESTLATSPQLREAAATLLGLGLAAFPGDRAMTMNLAYLRSLETLTDDVGVQTFDEALTPAIAGLETYVAGAPTDATAAGLLANLVLATDAEHGLDRAIAAAEPLLDAVDTEAAGRIIRADSLLFASDRHRTTSPFLARDEARRALDDYDHVIELTGDGPAYAGRARALDMLGERDAAIEAQHEAVSLAPTSAPWLIGLARLDACAGQVDAWRDDGQRAVAAATASAKPPVLGTRNVLVGGPGVDAGRFSIWSDLPAWDATIREQATDVTISALDPFPEPEACMTGTPEVGTALEDASIETALAAFAEGDLAAARKAVEPWYLDPADEGDGDTADGDTGGDVTDEGDTPTGDGAAASLASILGLLAGDQLTEGDTSILDSGALMSRLPPAAEARLCEGLAHASGLQPADVDAVTVCAAEAADRGGDHAAAARAIAPAARLDDPVNPASGSATLKAGLLSELTGDLELARSRYEVAASHTKTAIGGLLRLGDLDLREGDPSGALDHYALADAAIRTQASAGDEVVMDDALAARLAQYLDNNRGVALLMTAQDGAETPPDCVAFETVCREARDAFAAAMAADPMNPVYPMNAAWVARLTGDDDRATALLTESLEEGTPVVAPAHNDLGVLAARHGDFDEARTQFTQAISIDPSYDLATWNLGVLDSRQAGPMLLAGQALLADAAARNRDLLTHDIAFQTDERNYRLEVSGTQLELARSPGTGAAIGAAAFGAIATVGALGQLLSGMGSDAQDAAETVASEGLGRAHRRLRGVGSRVPGAGRGWPSWAVWVPAIVVLIVTTAWTAAWMAPDAIVTATLIGLAAAVVAMVVHASGHLLVAARMGARLRPSGWTPGLAIAVVGMPFHVPAGPFLAERLETGDQRRDWWVSFAGVAANLAAAAIAVLIYVADPMPFLRILIATQLAVAAFALIPSDPLDGDRLASRPIVLALLALGVAAASTALAVGAI